MADGVVTVLGAVKRPEREAGAPAQEALALKDALAHALGEVETSGQRDRRRRERYARFPGRDVVR